MLHMGDAGRGAWVASRWSRQFITWGEAQQL